MTDALIRRAERADLAAIVQLRREWTREEHGDIADPDFNEYLAAWFARELSRRTMWLAEEGGRPVGMMNLAVYERMPRPVQRLTTQMRTASFVWCSARPRDPSRFTSVPALAQRVP